MLACFRDATLLTVANVSKYPEIKQGDIETVWTYWHEWLKSKLDSEILGF
jgi:hypothetical protein